VRYYDLRISNAAGQVYQPAASGRFALVRSGTSFTSHPNNGIADPGALNIEADVITANANAPQGNSHIKVSGVGLGMISQASDLNGAAFTLSAGMRPGLPLATAQAGQAGIIAQGSVFAAYGNWQGPEQSLDLIVNALTLKTDQPIVLSWKAGTPLASALAATLSQAFPKFKQDIKIATLVMPNDEGGLYDNFWQFAGYLNGLTQVKGVATYGQNYPGVQITFVGSTVLAYDTTVPIAPKMIAFQDLIGQPTWIEPQTVSFKTVLRSDLAPGSQIVFPPGAVQSPYAQTTPAAAIPGVAAASKTTFQGKFFIGDVHHYMNFRQADGDSWSTVFTASPISLAGP